MHHQVNLLLLILPFFCSVFAGQKNYIVQQSENAYDAQSYSKERGNHYESDHYEYHHKPYPYKFGYDVKDEKGNVQYHKEEGDEYNVKKGSYGYTDAYGVYRHVDYIADHLGFRVKIRTNEPGTASYHPADVTIYSEPPPSHVYTNYEKYNDLSYREPEHSKYDHADQKTYAKSIKQPYNQQDHSGYSEPEHNTYNQPEHGQYSIPDQSSYSQPEHNDYSQQDISSYSQPDHSGYSESDQDSYSQPDHGANDQPDHNTYSSQQQQKNYSQVKGVVLKPEYHSVVTKQQQIDQGGSHPQLNHQKYTYVPVYIPNNVDYKN